MKMNLSLGSLILALAVLAIGCGRPAAPDVSFVQYEGGAKKKLSDFRGKVVLIDLWATWCGPCRQTMPIVERLHNQYGPNGLEVVAVTSEEARIVKTFLQENTVNYPIYLDPNNSVSEAFNSVSIPDCVVVGKDGSILFRGHPGDEGPLERAIQAGLQ